MRFRDLAHKMDSLQSRGSLSKRLARIFLFVVTLLLAYQQDLVFMVALGAVSFLLLTRLFRFAAAAIIVISIVLLSLDVLLVSICALAFVVLFSAK